MCAKGLHFIYPSRFKTESKLPISQIHRIGRASGGFPPIRLHTTRGHPLERFLSASLPAASPPPPPPPPPLERECCIVPPAPVSSGTRQATRRAANTMPGFSFEAELAKGDAVKDAEYEAWKAAKIAEIGAWRFKTVVCRHWLKNACMNGDRCEYLHHYDPDRMPECHNGQECNKPDCPFKHSGPRGKKECLFYKQGFCVHGPNCKFNHTKYTAEALPKYGDYSTLFDGKEHERPENKPLGDLVDPEQLGVGGNGVNGQPGSMLPPGAAGVVVPLREFPKNINYPQRPHVCRLCKHADRCYFAQSKCYARASKC